MKLFGYLIVLWTLAACSNPATPTMTPSATPAAQATEDLVEAQATVTATAAPATTAPAEVNATAAPTTTPLPPVATLTAPPAGFATYTAPHWVSFYYPEDWFLVRSGLTGVTLSNENVVGNVAGLPQNGAMFIVTERFYENSDPLLALTQEYLPNLNPDRETITGPAHAFVLNGRPAASASYQFAEPSGQDVELQITLVATPPERTVAILAMTSVAELDTFATQIQQMRDSLIVQPPAPAPALGTDAAPGNFEAYNSDDISFSYPAGWTVAEQPPFIQVAPADRDADAIPSNSIAIIPPQYFGGDSSRPATALVDETFRLYVLPAVPDAIPVSEIARATIDGREIARALYAGNVQGHPVLIIVASVKEGEAVIQALTVTGPEDPARADLEAIMDSLQSVPAP